MLLHPFPVLDVGVNYILLCLFCCPTIYQPSPSMILLLHRLRPDFGLRWTNGGTCHLFLYLDSYEHGKRWGLYLFSCFTPMALGAKTLNSSPSSSGKPRSGASLSHGERLLSFFKNQDALVLLKREKRSPKLIEKAHTMKVHWNTWAIHQSIGFNFCGHCLGFSMRRF